MLTKSFKSTGVENPYFHHAFPLNYVAITIWCNRVIVVLSCIEGMRDVYVINDNAGILKVSQYHNNYINYFEMYGSS